MVWESAVHANKTREEIDQSAQEARDRVVAQYGETLNDLYVKIDAAKAELESLKNDITGTHAGRIAEISNLIASHNEAVNALVQDRKELEANQKKLIVLNKALDESIIKETRRVSDNTAKMTSERKALDELYAKVDARQKLQDDVATAHSIVRAELDKRKSDLDAQAMEQTILVNAIDLKNTTLAQDIQNHTDAVTNHNNNVLAFQETVTRNEKVAEALAAKEKELEPLKQKYEDGLAANEVEAKRLRDENIILYGRNAEAQKRQEAAMNAERRANEQIEKLEAIKTEIDAKINKEK